MVAYTLIKSAFNRYLSMKGTFVKIIRTKQFKSEKAWGAKDIANMNSIMTCQACE